MKNTLIFALLAILPFKSFSQSKLKTASQSAKPSKQATISYLNQKLNENCIGRFGEVTEEYLGYDEDLKLTVQNWQDYSAFIVDSYQIKEENGGAYLVVTIRSQNTRKSFRSGVGDYDRYQNIVSTVPIAKIKSILPYNVQKNVEQTKSTYRKTSAAASGLAIMTTANNVLFDQQDIQKKDFVSFQQIPNNNPEESGKIKRAFENLKSYYKDEADPFAEPTHGTQGAGAPDLGKASEKMKAWYAQKEQKDGKVYAMLDLGQAYSYGSFFDLEDKMIELKPDFDQAMKWYNAAIVEAHGDQDQLDEAYSRIGIMLQRGDVCKPDLSKVLPWYEKMRGRRANGGNAVSMGVMHVLVDQDYDKAMDYFKTASTQSGAGLNAIGLMYLNGLGVAKNTTEAENYFRKALNFRDRNFASLDSTTALYNLGLIALKNQDSAGALKLFRKVPVMQSCLECRYQLAYSFVKNRQYKNAIDIYMPEDQGTGYHLSALLAYIYATGGDGIKQDYILAVSLLASAHAMFLEDRNQIGDYLSSMDKININKDESLPVLQIDFKTAFQKNSQAAKTGDIGAISNLAYLYWQGLGVGRNVEFAIKYYKQVAAKGEVFALFQLSNIYDEVDRDLSTEWYSKWLAARWKERHKPR